MAKETQRKADAKRAGKRIRNWTFVVYEDSAPADWQNKLAEQCVPMFISPKHDKDVDPNGEPKKPHWHVVVMFTSLHSEQQAQEISDVCSKVKVQQVKDIVGMARYLCHLDNPEKAQYSAGDVIALGGADYLEKVSKAADTDCAVSEMMDWCIENHCYSFFKLSNYARQNRSDWFRVLSSARTVFLTAWLKSFKWELDEEERQHDYWVDRTHVGEVAKNIAKEDEEREKELAGN